MSSDPIESHPWTEDEEWTILTEKFEFPATWGDDKKQQCVTFNQKSFLLFCFFAFVFASGSSFKKSRE